MRPLWYSGAPILKDKLSKSLIHEYIFKGYRGLAINPYQGCHHRCAYCYATYEWSPDFYNSVYAKRNAAQILDEQLSTWTSDEIGPVMVGSATDAYQPAELRFGLTRACVKVLQRHNVAYYVFTKSSSVLRDIDLHASYSDNCSIIWSITTTDERIRRVIEPGTPPARRLFSAIAACASRGITCGINVDPIIPLATDNDAEFKNLVCAAKVAGTKHLFGSVLRLRLDIWDRIRTALSLLRIPDFESIYNDLYNLTSGVTQKGYCSVNKEYEKQALDKLYSIVYSAGLSNNFPRNIGSRKLKRQSIFQTEIADFIRR